MKLSNEFFLSTRHGARIDGTGDFAATGQDLVMAKRNSEPLSGPDRAKVRVLFAEVEGNNESVQEALKTMVSAMSRQVRVISEHKTNGNPTLLEQAEPDAFEEVIEQAEDGDEIVEETLAPSARKTRGTGKKFDRNAGLNLVADLNFRPPEKPALKEFMEGKHPKNDIEIALATVYYMQPLMELPKISAAHLMTAFKEAGRPIPNDVRQTLRNMKKLKIWLKFADLDDVKTTTQGDNFVEHEMGKTESPR